MRHAGRFTLALCLAIVSVSASAAASKAPRLPTAPLNLGDTNADLVYTPLSPCRIIDTRLVGSFMNGGSTRSFFVSGTNGFPTQGGTSGGCGVPSGATSVLINFVAVTPDGLGNLKGSAYPNSIPTTGSIINYQLLTPTLNIANAVTFPICDPSAGTCTFDITLFTNGGGTHVVADVLGYFRRFPKEQTIMSVNPGTGLTGGGTSGDVTLGIDTSSAATGQTLMFNGTGLSWFTPAQGTITGVTAGTGLSGGATSGIAGLSIANSGVDTLQLANNSVTPPKINSAGATSGQALMFNGSAVAWTTPPQGTITGVSAGTGLTGGATSGTATLSANFTASGGMNGTATTVARGDHSHYARTVVVNSGGSAVTNGTALRNALSSIVTASATNPYLLKIEPGIYDLGTLGVVMKPFVDIEGSGQLVTKITSAAGSNATVTSADNAELRQLTVEATTPSSGVAIGIGVISTAARLDHVTVVATSPVSAYGIFCNLSGSATLIDSTISANGASNGPLALYISSNSAATAIGTSFSATSTAGATPIINNGNLSADRIVVTSNGSPSGGSFGVNNSGVAVITNSTISASSSVSGTVWGIYNTGLTTTLTNVTITASGPGGGQAIYSYSASGAHVLSIDSSRMTATGNAGARGIVASPAPGTMTMTVRNSEIVSSAATIDTPVGMVVRVANSKLDGAAVVGGATCTFVYDENFVGYPSTCP